MEQLEEKVEEAKKIIEGAWNFTHFDERILQLLQVLQQTKIEYDNELKEADHWRELLKGGKDFSYEKGLRSHEKDARKLAKKMKEQIETIYDDLVNRKIK